MSATVDTNILIYASNKVDPVHDRAKDLIASLAAGPDLIYLFWPVLLGFLRLVTHPSILPRPLAPEEAMANVAALLERPHVRAPGEIEGFWDMFRATSQGRARGNGVPDAHLAALMRQHGVRIIFTRDRGFRRFDGIDVRDPFA